MTRKTMAILLILALASAVTYAQTVRLSLIYEGRGDYIQAFNEKFLDGAMAALFDSGFIATNDVPKPGAADVFAAIRPTADDREGFVELVLVVFARFPAGDSPALPECSYRLINVSNGRVLAEGEIRSPAAAPRTSAEFSQATARLGELTVQASLRAF